MIPPHYRRRIFALALLAIIASGAISIFAVAVRSAEVESLRQTLSRDAIDERLAHTFATLNDFPGSAGKDLLFLRTLSSVQNLHTSEKWDEQILNAAKSDFSNFMKDNYAYKELYFVRKSNGCAVRVKRDTGTPSASGEKGLPTEVAQASTPCDEVPLAVSTAIADVNALSIGEIYISPLTLYENTPVFFYATPVNTNCNIISMIDANYFLEDIRRLARDGEKIFLLDGNGSYLANYDHTKEKLWGADDSFYHDFPSVASSTLSDISMRRFETEKEIFTFWRIYPTESNFALYGGASKLLDGEHRDKYFWIIAAVSQKPQTDAFWGRSSVGASISAIAIAHLLMFLLVCVLGFKKLNYER